MDISYDERIALCALNDIFGFEPGMAHTLLAHAGSAVAVFEMGDELIDNISGPFSKFRNTIRKEALGTYAAELDRVHSLGAYFLTIRDKAYPKALAECPDAPVGLYIRSYSPPEDIFGIRPQISVVGTRDISLYGKDWCRRLVFDMADCRCPPLIVSGLALGTDITAHSAAIEAGMPTVAVLPCGIDDIYPQSHRSFAGKVASTPGCALITDYRTRTQPKAINFLRRNRIIAGLSSATIVVESKIKGGALITAGFAFDYDRDVYALPGRIDDIRSQGCNWLIRTKVAEPIDNPDFFLGSLGLGAYNRRTLTAVEEEVKHKFSDDPDVASLVKVACFIKRHRGCCPEDIATALGLDYKDALSAAGRLEAEGLIECDLLRRCIIKPKNV